MRIRHSLEHFLREAERCVPHLAPEERRAWAEKCHAEHPGVTEQHITVAPGDRRQKSEVRSQKLQPIPALTGGAEGARDSVCCLLSSVFCLPKLGRRWLFCAVALAALLFLCAGEARCQDPGGFNGPRDPAFRSVPLVWVVNAPSGSCTGVSIEYSFQTNPPALYGCNQSSLTWGQISGVGVGGGSGCIPTGGAGVVQASTGGGACQNISITDNGTIVKATEPFVTTGTVPTVSGGYGVLAGNSTNGGILIGQGTTNDLTLQNKSGSTVCSVATGTTTLNCTGLQLGGASVLTTAVTSVGTNNGLTGGAITTTGTLGLASIAAGGMLCNTGTTSQSPTVGNCGISVPQSVTGTVAVSTSSPLSLNATTGNLTCSTCATTTNGGALSGTSPVSISAAGAISCSTCITGSGSAGQVVWFTGGATLSGAGPGTAKQLVLSNGASGPQFSDFPDVKVVPAALCNAGTAGPGWTLPSSGGFSAACRAGTNNLLGALQGTPSTGATAYFDFELPGDWDTSNEPYVNVFYGSGSNTSGTVIFTVSTGCMGAEAGGTTDDPSFAANSAFATQTMATANRAWAVSGQLTTVTSGNNCAAGSNMIVKIVLSGTASSAINVYKATITTPRLVTVQAD